jgi:Uma2 family endonuclease
MSIEQLDIRLRHNPWELEEPRRRRWSPVELEFITRAGLLATEDVELRSGRIVDARNGEPIRWSAETYERMGDLGLFGTEDRVELLDGEVLEMSPQRSFHATGVTLASIALSAVFGHGCHLRVQLPLRPSATEEPEPDLAVVPGEVRDYTNVHPSAAWLVLEISDTTLRFDLKEKASLYASVGIQDYWVVDLRNGCVHVLRDPVADPLRRYGYCYQDVRSLYSGENIAPLAALESRIEIRDLLPVIPGE